MCLFSSVSVAPEIFVLAWSSLLTVRTLCLLICLPACLYSQFSYLHALEKLVMILLYSGILRISMIVLRNSSAVPRNRYWLSRPHPWSWYLSLCQGPCLTILVPCCAVNTCPPAFPYYEMGCRDSCAGLVVTVMSGPYVPGSSI